MAEYNEVVKQFARMCEHYATCDECPLCPVGYMGEKKHTSGCKVWAFKSPIVFEHKVTAWAAEHPEPKYPTWGEWLAEQGVVIFTNSHRYEEDERKIYLLCDSIENQIPVDIAEKLGIEPKEGV